ncbi:hypothetical protein BV898_11112 [Hypsibius exemplaris]|uniref:Ionotropic glutamate receptor C-terminal domain-containing protein n=1 Tax=Hypsibius exemplaris TaxID=2072580 RepID=A0A1W0WHQ3_HYPEX|nr:hypothetical protein BV898_11112 [Hypsibius exemplaris]
MTSDATKNGSSLMDVILQQVLDGVADIGLIELLRTPPRMATYSAIQSPILIEYSLLIHKSFLSPKCAAATCVNLLDAFTTPTWVIFLCLLLLVVSGRQISQKVAAHLQPESEEIFECAIPAEPGSTLATARYRDSTRTVSQGMLILSTALVFTLMGTFCNGIFLTAVNIVMPLKLTLEPHLAATFSYVEEFCKTEFTVHTTHTVRDQFLISNHPELNILAEKMITTARYNDDFLQAMADFGKAGTRTTFLASSPSYGRVAYFTCDFVEILPNLYSASSSPYCFRRNSQLYQDFSQRFQRLRETGLVEFISERYVELYGDYFLRREGKVGALCEPRGIPNKPTVARRDVGMDDVKFTFPAALAVVVGTGLSSLVVEIIMYYRKRK